MQDKYDRNMYREITGSRRYRSRVYTAGTLALLTMWFVMYQARAVSDPTALLQTAVQAACKYPHADLLQMAGRIPSAVGIDDVPVEFRSSVIGWRRRFSLPGGAELVLERIAPRGQFRRLSAEYAAPSAQGVRPELLAHAGPDCEVRLGRRLVYDDRQAQAVALEQLDQTLAPTGRTEPLNPPVPTGDDPGGVLVAMVDAGVNYLLPEINARLARDNHGNILGYDYWDLDDRPFDANPARSLFFPQRHGTRTASVLLREASVARLVPYRYPRPDMSRMAALVEDAAAKGVVIVNLSLGSNNVEDWQAFADVATLHPEMLFIVSAGNNGRDIDIDPVFPAAFPLENIITVTSSELTGELARGSNMGRESVDLLVPAENLEATSFHGRQIRVSGSSYAASRVAALAARLLSLNPKWRAPELKTAIFARALVPLPEEPVYVSRGFIPDPLKADSYPVADPNAALVQVAHDEFTVTELYGGGADGSGLTHTFRPTFVYFEGTAWDLDGLRSHTRQAGQILKQCGIFMFGVDVYRLQGPDMFRYFRDRTAKELVRRMRFPKPTVYLVRDTLQKDAYEAEAIGKGNSRTRPTLRYTIWVTESLTDPGIGLAHELVHILMDSGRHVDLPRNLMREETSADNTELTREQCSEMTRIGVANTLLNPLLASPSK